MSRLFSVSMLAMLAACDASAPAGRPSPPQAARGDALAAMEFRGRRPCVDCLGIQAWLRLEDAGDAPRYLMVETYYDARGERRFEDAGEWTSEGDLLRLQSRDGGQRVYARMPDDSLQARASDGAPLPAAADDVLVPMGPGERP